MCQASCSPAQPVPGHRRGGLAFGVSHCGFTRSFPHSNPKGLFSHLRLKDTVCHLASSSPFTLLFSSVLDVSSTNWLQHQHSPRRPPAPNLSHHSLELGPRDLMTLIQDASHTKCLKGRAHGLVVTSPNSWLHSPVPLRPMG